MEIIDENKFNNEVYGDVQYINDCRSLRMRLLIVEKIIVIILPHSSPDCKREKV